MTHASATCRIALAGLGTVGAALLRQLHRQNNALTLRCGRPLQVVAVCARDRNRKRDIPDGDWDWYTDSVEMAQRAPADIFVELIGGAEGAARAACETALANGRHLVTANKALIATHGFDLARLAEENNRALAFEAAVGGGIPAIHAVRDGLAGDRITAVYGILNGTCNYIITEMRKTGASFAEILQQAVEKGYAEADPSTDVDGVDAAHKIAILAALAFRVRPVFAGMHIEGIRNLSPRDFQYAAALGYAVKLLALAHSGPEGVMQRVHPVLTPSDAPVAAVDDVFNIVAVESDLAGSTLLQGRGAGGDPTAAAVLSDLVDIAAGRPAPAFGVAVACLGAPPRLPITARRGAYYLRLSVAGQALGAEDALRAICSQRHIPLPRLLSRAADGGVDIAATTGVISEAEMIDLLRAVETSGIAASPPRSIRIERPAH